MFNLNLSGDNLLQIQGAKKVLSCTPTQAVVAADKKIIISGNSIEVKKLNLENEEICLAGVFSNIKFAAEEEKKSFLKRIFK